MESSARQPLLFESCPASVLKRLDLYKESYKGTKPEHRNRRKTLLSIFSKGVCVGGTSSDKIVLQVPKRLQTKLVEDAGADALDAVLAAVGASCATRRKDFPAPHDGEFLKIYKSEACVYC